MPTSNQYLLSYGPLALTLTSAVIDIALTLHTSDKSRKSQQVAANFYKSLRNYYPSTIALASVWSSGYLTYIQLTDGTYKNITDLFDKVSTDLKSVIVTAPVLTSGIAVGLNGINIGARIVTATVTNSQSSLSLLNANKVFDILGNNLFPQLSSGLLVGTVGGAVAGVGKLFLSVEGGVVNSILSTVGVSDTVITTIKQFSEPQLDAYSDILTEQINTLKTLSGTNFDDKIKTAQNNLINRINTAIPDANIPVVI